MRSEYCKSLGISDPESDKDQFIWYGHWNPIILKDDSCRVINNKENRLEYIISKDIGIKANLQTTYLTKDCRYYNMPRETLQSITEYFQVAKVEMEAKNLQAEAIIFNIESNNKVSIADYIAGSNSSKQNVRRVALQMHSSNEEKRLASAAVEARDRNLKEALATIEEPLKSYIKNLKKTKMKLLKSLKKKESRSVALKERLLLYRNLTLATVSRYTVTSDKWHSLNPEACLYYFGYQTWQELKIYLLIFFRSMKKFSTEISTAVKGMPSRYLPFEKCLMWLMRHRVGLDLRPISDIFGVGCIKKVSRFITHVTPYFSSTGLQLSKLDITTEYLSAEAPLAYKTSKLPPIAALVDGKDFMIEQPRNNGLGRRHSYSDKVHHAAFRSIPLVLKTGLVIDHSYPVLGSCSESSLLKTMGRDKHGYCPFSGSSST